MAEKEVKLIFITYNHQRILDTGEPRLAPDLAKNWIISSRGQGFVTVRSIFQLLIPKLPISNGLRSKKASCWHSQRFYLFQKPLWLVITLLKCINVLPYYLTYRRIPFIGTCAFIRIKAHAPISRTSFNIC